jgi:8-oxo-dGTP pyrophosphatase MutT (NUDIX family)
MAKELEQAPEPIPATPKPRAAGEDLRLSEEDLGLPGLSKAEIEAPKVAHGQPASIPYLHRKSAVPTANFGATYGQHLEPAGKYISHHEDLSHRPETLGTGQTQSWYEYGVAHFKKPWVHKMSDSEGFIDWKSHLSEANQGKTGKALSRHLNRHGYDGVVVLDPHGSISEMVNLGAPETVTHAMRKALGNLLPGSPIDPAARAAKGDSTARQFQVLSAHNYDHMLSPEQRAAGYQLTVEHRKQKIGATEDQHRIRARLDHNGIKAGVVEGTVKDSKTIEPHATLQSEHRRQNLGTTMFEALYTHARNAGFTHALITEHTPDAHHVLTKLAAKHGLVYSGKPMDDPEMGGRYYSEFMQPLGKAEAPVDCAAVLVTDGYGRILLGQRRDNGRWTMPAGHLNPGEAPEDGARRELFEEAALSPEHLTFLKVAPLHDGARLHCFTALGTGIPHSRNDPDQECEKWEWIDARGGIPANVWDNLHGPDGDRNVLRQVFDLKKAEREWLAGGFAGLAKKLPAYNPDTALTPPEEEHVANWQAASDDKWTDANRPTRETIPRMEGPARVRGLHRMTGMTQVKMGPDGKRSYLMHRAMSPTEAAGTVGDTHVKHDTRTSWSPKSGPALGELYHVVQHFAKEYGGLTVSAWVPEDKIHAMLPMWGRTHPHAVEQDQWTRENTSFDGNVKTRGPGYQARHWEVIVDPHKSALATPEEQATAFANDTDHLDTRINERGARYLPALSNYGRKFAGPSRAPEALDPAEYRSRIQKSESETCERCSEPATKRVLWAEGMAYLPACDKHIPALKNYFGDDFSGLRDIKKAESEAASLLSHPNPIERALALKLDSVTPADLGVAVLDPHPAVWQAAFHHPHANLALETLANNTRDAAGLPLFERHDLLLVDPRCQNRHLEAMVRAVRSDAYLPVHVQAARLQALGAHPSAETLAKSEWAQKALSQATRSPAGQMVHADLENTPRQHGHLAEAYHEHIGGAKGMTALDGDLHSGGTTRKAVYKIPVAGHLAAQRMMVKPYHESHEPLSGWAELSSQHLYNAAGIDHLHQKSFAAPHGDGDRRVHAVVIPIEKATPVDQVPTHEIHSSNPGAREDARKIAAMDFLTGNDDRHAGNLMVREDGSLMAIDHGASFRYGHDDEPVRSFEFYAGGGPGVVDPITSQADFGNYKNTFKWWKDVAPDVRAAFHDRMQLVKHPEVRKQLGERFEHRASWLDARAAEGDKLHNGWHWRKIEPPMAKAEAK